MGFKLVPYLAINDANEPPYIMYHPWFLDKPIAIAKSDHMYLTQIIALYQQKQLTKEEARIHEFQFFVRGWIPVDTYTKPENANDIIIKKGALTNE